MAAIEAAIVRGAGVEVFALEVNVRTALRQVELRGSPLRGHFRDTSKAF